MISLDSELTETGFGPLRGQSLMTVMDDGSHPLAPHHEPVELAGGGAAAAFPEGYKLEEPGEIG